MLICIFLKFFVLMCTLVRLYSLFLISTCLHLFVLLCKLYLLLLNCTSLYLLYFLVLFVLLGTLCNYLYLFVIMCAHFLLNFTSFYLISLLFYLISLIWANLFFLYFSKTLNRLLFTETVTRISCYEPSYRPEQQLSMLVLSM